MYFENISLPKATIRRAELSTAHLVGTSASESDYIKDGLVFWLDGMDKGGEEGKWIDLVGGVEFFRDYVATVEPEWGDNYVRGVLKSSVPVFYPVKKSTIEFAQTTVLESVANDRWFGGGANGGICGGIARKHLLLVEGETVKPITYNDITIPSLGAHTISANVKLMLHNGASNYNSQTVDYWTHAETHGCIGNNLNLHKYHSIRIYDRLLSEEEMRHNQEVDRKRFGLVYPEPTMTLEYEYGDEEDYPELTGNGVSCD